MKLKLIVLLMMLLGVALVPAAAAQDMMEIEAADVEVMSGGQAYQSYLAAPTGEGMFPGIILIHSFNGMEEGYRTLVDQFASEGFVVLALGWQTFEQSPADDVVMQLVQDGIAMLTERDDVDAARIGLTGFCAGGRYTMLFMPQVEGLAAGVAWYGFPYNGEPAPVDFVDQFEAPMLMIHGTEDNPSPIEGIYDYATALRGAGASFELKVYSGEPHGFMLTEGQLRTDEVARDAYNEMITFFKRKLGTSMV
ncbi:MAG: dienelactone hydrolase [Anaerolineaceae bacterium]|nr:dienelactone hydrolase [Anaerolineaceae bacterium]